MGEPEWLLLPKKLWGLECAQILVSAFGTTPVKAQVISAPQPAGTGRILFWLLHASLTRWHGLRGLDVGEHEQLGVQDAAIE